MSDIQYRYGTHRVVPPATTLERIRPHLPDIGVTRCARVTGLDRIGIPVYCAIRPRSASLQVSNGKGLRDDEAQASALMEALEFFLLESPPPDLQTATPRHMPGAPLRDLPEFRPNVYLHDDLKLCWVSGCELVSAQETPLPAHAVWPIPPALFGCSSNGVASGNTILEATLHALYEVIERHCVALLSRGGRLNFDGCRFVDPSRVTDERVRGLLDRFQAADVKPVLIRLPGLAPVHTFMAVILDAHAFSPASKANVGYGAHLHPAVAAVRALTEAAQSRLTYIHGAREDLNPNNYHKSQRKIFAYFNLAECEDPWDFEDESSTRLQSDYETVLRTLQRHGFDRAYRVDLTRHPPGLPVVKVMVPGLQFNPRLV